MARRAGRSPGTRRAGLATTESDARRVKVNPLADWSEERVKAHLLERDLPQHPLVFSGYSSVGCIPCTRPVRPGEPVRAGRWWSSEKTECGIHKNP
ncbi:MAG: phosphoadenosine phosphosulfate reductase family protein [Alphaproteobacteria bacterium]